MIKKLALLLLMTSFISSYAQSNNEADIKAINKMLKKQRIAWSKNDIEGYMEGYWKSDSLKFYGSNGVTYGWKNTLDRYKRAYPSEDHTGKLNFRINDISQISEEAYFILGEYHIKREVGNADGIFMLVVKKINGEWKIIADTST